ncbi:MAG: NAD(P)H-hydrate dehydratase [Deltaproteobacteria bacterium]|nr:NAD(P)H-hydrate dehydratase [Deltaproteobacteria bacterium]
MKLADARTIQSMDRAAVEDYGISGLQLMENAGRGLAEIIKRELSGIQNPQVAILAGKGNNGGDGFVAARHLKNSGISAYVLSLSKMEEIKGDAGSNASSWHKMGGEIFPLSTKQDLKNFENELRGSDIIVDAIFGTGLSSKVLGIHAEVINHLNSLNKKVIAVDIPSGIDATTGSVLGCAVKAYLTVTMAMPKLGLYVYPGRSYAGRVETVDIGIPSKLLDTDLKWNLITEDDLRKILKPRVPDSHKGLYGHLLVVAGSTGMTGAAYMAGISAMRVGAGLTTVAVPESLNPIMEVKTTEVMTKPLPETESRTVGLVSLEKVKEIMEGKDALVIGPGVGNSEDIYNLIKAVIKVVKTPLVIDADGLNSIAGHPEIFKDLATEVILTPHPGEMARLLDVRTSDVQADRVGSATRVAKQTGATVVLKGAGTVIADPKGKIFINPTGNPGLATGGTGDILAGMIGGLLAQGYSAIEASTAAAYMHGLAGDELKNAQGGEIGMIATDLLAFIPKIINSFISSQ